MATKTYNVQMSDNELRNVAHGLIQLHRQLADNLAAVKPDAENCQDLRQYYKEKMIEVTVQAKSYNDLLTSQTNEAGQ